MAAVYRAPMRARDRELAPGRGAERGVEAGVVGIGDTPGEKGDRMLRRFKGLRDGEYVWTRLPDGSYRVGQIAGPWRYDDSAGAAAVGIPHVRDARWLDVAFGEDEVPAAVAATFARGGRNLQRIHGGGVEEQTAALWERGA